MTEHLRQNYVLTGLVWEPENISNVSQNYQKWLNRIRRTQRQLVFQMDDGGLLTGYSAKGALFYEPFAIHVKNDFGDGVYYFHEDENKEETYFVIIKEGRIVSGSDTVINTEFFNQLHSELSQPESPYIGVNVTEISPQWIENMIEQCKQRRSALKRKRNIVLASIVSVGLLILAVIAYLLMIIPS